MEIKQKDMCNKPESHSIHSYKKQFVVATAPHGIEDHNFTVIDTLRDNSTILHQLKMYNNV